MRSLIFAAFVSLLLTACASLGDPGRRDEAMVEYRAAIALKPQSAAPHNNLGNALRDLGRRDEAMAEYRAAIALNPKYAAPHNNLGNALRELAN